MKDYYFNFRTKNQELIDKFLNKMSKDGDLVMSSLEISNVRFTVSDNEARSFVNSGGAFSKTWTELVNLISMFPKKVSAKWKIHRAKIMGYLTTSSAPSLQKFFNELRKFIALFREESGKWNVLFYTHYKDDITGG